MNKFRGYIWILTFLGKKFVGDLEIVMGQLVVQQRRSWQQTTAFTDRCSFVINLRHFQ